MASTSPGSDPKPQPARKPARPAQTAAAASPEDNTPLGRVMIRNEFYRDGYRMMMRIAFFEGIAILGLIVAMVVIVNAYQPENRYFATTEDGRVVPMVPLSDPNLSRPAILSWAAQAASETMTFGFNDYRRRLQESSRHFTRKGWSSFVKALEDSGTIEAVETNRQVISAVPSAAPTIVGEGLMNGIYQWQIEMPMMVTYQFGQQNRSVNTNLRLTVVRVPKLESPSGIGIEQWVAFTGGS